MIIEIKCKNNIETFQKYMRILNLIYGIKSLDEIKFKDNNIFNINKNNIIFKNNDYKL
tara:strand:- start:445 stop:618 length:174 start_codon:yes stop_codon:yes gene_type:complete